MKKLLKKIVILKCTLFLIEFILNPITLSSQYVGGASDGYSSAINENIYHEFSAPVLIQPINNSIIQSLSPLFQWDGDYSSDSYNLQLSHSSSFTTLLYDINGIIENSFILTNLDTSATYFWRVRAMNNYGTSPWSEIWNFTTFSNKVKLISPLNNSIQQPTDLQLSWQLLSNAIKYHIQIAKNTDFLNTIYENAELSDNYVKIELDLNTQYYWRVRAANNSEVTNWSEVWTFKTLNYIVRKPNLIKPIDNDEISNNNILFKWESQSSDVFFKFQISLDNDFLFKEIDTIIKYNEISKTLDLNTVYFWRVQASDGFNNSEWSDIRKFKTKSNSNVNDFIYNKDYCCIYPNPASNEVFLNYYLPYPMLVEINIYDLQGNLLLKKSEYINNCGNIKTNISINNLSGGYYCVLINSDYITYSKIFLKE